MYCQNGLTKSSVISEVLFIIAILDLDDLELAEERPIQYLVFPRLVEHVDAETIVLVVDLLPVFIILTLLKLIALVFHALPLLHLRHEFVKLFLSLLLNDLVILFIFIL